MLPKYKDELTVLSWCAKPIMPVFNFTAGQDLSEWQAMLARRSLHVISSFDTVAFDFEGEIRLWDNLATMLPERSVLDALIHMRREEWQKLDKQSRLAIAHFLLAAAAYSQTVADKENIPAVRQTMQTSVRGLEQDLQQQLLQHYRFYQNQIHGQDWALQAFSQDPFDPELLKAYGIRTTKGAAAGALIGLGFDTLTLGGSLGMGTAIGGLVGGLASNWQSLSDTISGHTTLHIDAATLTLLAARAADLLGALQSRGHAAQNAITLNSGQTPWPADKLPSELAKARQKPKWSQLNGEAPAAAGHNRQEAAAELALRFKH